MRAQTVRGLIAIALACRVVGGGGLAECAWDEEDFHRKPAVTYMVSEGNSVIGELRARRVRKGETLLDIARQYSLGYNEVVESNPGLDVWLPPPGAMLLLPTAMVLPCCERRGLVVNIPEMRLYYFLPSADDTGVTQVITFAVGLGRDDWRTPQGKFTIRAKTENPTWVIPESIRAEHALETGDTRTAIPGGTPDNPLGKYRLALSLPSYGIHGTNIPWGVGLQVSHGCIRLYPEDIERLFPLVSVGTPGTFVYQPVKVGFRAGEVYVEATRDIYGLSPAIWKEATAMIDRLGVADRVDPERLMAALRQPDGIPVRVSRWPDDGRDIAGIPATEEVLGDVGVPRGHDRQAADD